MLVDPSNSTAGAAVTGAIRQAAQATGTSFQYLLATAQVESGLNPQAGASTSSARGLFQFIDQTWLATMKQSGPALGYGQYAAAITRSASGRYEVQDPTLRSEILKLRNDPTANAVMAGAFTQANAAVLSGRLGRAPSEGELYIAHFLGAGGAARLISAAAANPNAGAARYFPDAARANSSIFYDRATGAPRSLAQVRDLLTARYDVAARSKPSMPAVTLAQITSEPGTVAAAAAAAGSAAPSPAAAAAAAAPSAPTARPVRTVPIFLASAGTAASAAASAPAAAPAAPATAAAPVPDTAGMTSAFAAAVPSRAAQENQIFHNLFADPDRSGPVAEVVSQLWGVASAAPGATGTSAAPSGDLRDLFKDTERGT